MLTKIEKVRLSYPKLWVAKPYDENSTYNRYSADFLIPKNSPQAALVIKNIKSLLKDTFADKAELMFTQLMANPQKTCLKDGDLSGKDETAGMWVLCAHRKEEKGRVKIVDRKGQPLSPEDGKPYGGCYVTGFVDLYVQTGQYKGIRSELVGVQFVEDGPAFGGGTTISDDMFDNLDADIDGADML